MKKIAFILTVLSLIVTAAFPAQVRLPKIWVASEVIRASDLNADFRAIASGINGGLDFSNFADGVTIPLTILENGSLVTAHASRHRLGGADPLTGTFTIHLQDGTCSTPTTSIGAANKGYVDAYLHPTLTTHVASNTNPHGTILYQDTIVATNTIATSAVFRNALIGTESVGLALITSATVDVATITDLRSPIIDYLDTASQSLSDHLASNTNPHGDTLYQNTIVASCAKTILAYTVPYASGPYLYAATDTINFVGQTVCGFLMKSLSGGVESDDTTGIFWNPISKYFVMQSSLGSGSVKYKVDENAVDFGGAEIQNFTVTATQAKYIASQANIFENQTIVEQYQYVSNVIGTETSGMAEFGHMHVSASATAGYYDITANVRVETSVPDWINSYVYIRINGSQSYDPSHGINPWMTDFSTVTNKASFPGKCIIHYLAKLSPGDDVNFIVSCERGYLTEAHFCVTIRYVGKTHKFL